MNWMICYDYGKNSDQVFSEMIQNQDSAIEALKAYQEKSYYDKDARIISINPVNKDIFAAYYEVYDMEKFSKGQDAVKRMRNKIAQDVGSYEKKTK